MPIADWRLSAGSGRSGSAVALWAVLLALPITPALASPGADEESVVRHLEALEAELAARPVGVEATERIERLLRRVRSLQSQAHAQGVRGLERRLRSLELQARTGQGTQVPAVGQATVGGTVRRASSGAPIANVYVELWDENGGYVQGAVTNAQGAYSLTDLASGTYFAVTYSGQGFIDELYDDIPCPGGVYNGCMPTDGTPIQVTNGTVQVDFSLALGGTIAGTLRGADTGLPLVHVYVTVWDDAGQAVGWGYPDSEGRYRIEGLVAGTHFVATENYSEYLDELYDDLPCPGGPYYGCDPTSGTPVAVALETTTSGIDFTLERLGSIEGVVTDGLTGLPIPWTDVAAYREDGSYANSHYTDQLGRYRIGGLTEGTYFVATWGFQGFDPVLYDGIPCPPQGCDPTTGTPVGVSLNSTTSGIDFVLTGGCLYSETALCLTGDRFRVEARWRTPSGNQGLGQALEMTNDTGYFWFFAPNNVEAVVKVINACTLPGFNNFWVFAGGLTNVEVTITVTDVESQLARVYKNELGVQFQPIQDTAAFSTCP